MTQTSNWTEDYRLLLLQLYLRKPMGIKPMYNKQMIDLCLELHIKPRELFTRMCELASPNTPSLERLWERYGNAPKRLSRAIKRLRSLSGFGNADMFYDGVDICETFEKDFRPIADNPHITLFVLTLILDLYFRLTPITMVPDTPEIQELARTTKVSADDIADIMEIFQHIDPYLNRDSIVFSPFLPACQQVWQRYSEVGIEVLAAKATEMKEYFA